MPNLSQLRCIGVLEPPPHAEITLGFKEMHEKPLKLGMLCVMWGSYFFVICDLKVSCLVKKKKAFFGFFWVPELK